MASPTISFCCSTCGVRLTVPSSLAGVEGPCPGCRTTIRAPFTDAVAIPAMPTGSAIRAEPRETRERPAGPPITPRRRTDDSPLHRPSSEYHDRRSHKDRRIIRSLLPILSGALAGAVVYFILALYHPRDPKPSPPFPPSDPAAAGAGLDGSPARISPVGATPTPASALPPNPANTTGTGSTPTLPEDPVASLVNDAGGAGTGAGTKSPELPQPAPVVNKAKAAEALLVSFLKARDAATRAPMVEPATKPEELEGTILAGPLPEVTEIISDKIRGGDGLESLTEFTFCVTWKTADEKLEKFNVDVRQRGDSPPAVFLPAFLDLPGGRLAHFGAAPSKGMKTFHVILEPSSGCFESNVPDPDRKFTLKLKRTALGKEVVRAYASKNSHFEDMVRNAESGLSWGARVPATVGLEWNTRDDPSKPYLELMEIKALNWNP